MLFKSAAVTQEKKRETTAEYPCLQGRKQQLLLSGTIPTSTILAEPHAPLPLGLRASHIVPHAEKKGFGGRLLTQRLVQLCHLWVVPARGLCLVAGSTEGSQGVRLRTRHPETRK